MRANCLNLAVDVMLQQQLGMVQGRVLTLPDALLRLPAVVSIAPQAHIWGLDQQLDKFTTDYVQQHLQCGSHGLLTIAELDFAFPPNSSPAMVIQAKLKEHSTTGSALPTFGSSAGNLSAKRPQGAAGWLRDLRVLQEPIPRLHNFPEVRLASADI